MGRRARPRTADGPKLIAAANHDLAAVVLTLRRFVGGATRHHTADCERRFGVPNTVLFHKGGAYRGRRGC